MLNSILKRLLTIPLRIIQNISIEVFNPVKAVAVVNDEWHYLKPCLLRPAHLVVISFVGFVHWHHLKAQVGHFLYLFYRFLFRIAIFHKFLNAVCHLRFGHLYFLALLIHFYLLWNVWITCYINKIAEKVTKKVGFFGKENRHLL